MLKVSFCTIPSNNICAPYAVSARHSTVNIRDKARISAGLLCLEKYRSLGAAGTHCFFEALSQTCMPPGYPGQCLKLRSKSIVEASFRSRFGKKLQHFDADGSFSLCFLLSIEQYVFCLQYIAQVNVVAMASR